MKVHGVAMLTRKRLRLEQSHAEQIGQNAVPVPVGRNQQITELAKNGNCRLTLVIRRFSSHIEGFGSFPVLFGHNPKV